MGGGHFFDNFALEPFLAWPLSFFLLPIEFCLGVGCLFPHSPLPLLGRLFSGFRALVLTDLARARRSLKDFPSPRLEKPQRNPPPTPHHQPQTTSCFPHSLEQRPFSPRTSPCLSLNTIQSERKDSSDPPFYLLFFVQSPRIAFHALRLVPPLLLSSSALLVAYSVFGTVAGIRTERLPLLFGPLQPFPVGSWFSGSPVRS